MFSWDFEPQDVISKRLNKLALDAISKIVFEETEENPDREIRYERITGILCLLAEIDEDMNPGMEGGSDGTDS